MLTRRRFFIPYIESSYRNALFLLDAVFTGLFSSLLRCREPILELGDRGEKNTVSRHVLTGSSKEKRQKTFAADEAAAGAGGASRDRDGRHGRGDARRKGGTGGAGSHVRRYG